MPLKVVQMFPTRSIPDQTLAPIVLGGERACASPELNGKNRGDVPELRVGSPPVGPNKRCLIHYDVYF